jgi:predicted acetyltransferase
MSADRLVLRALRPEDEAVARAAQETMAEEGFTFLLAWEDDVVFTDYIARLERIERGEPPMGRFVESSFLVAEVDGVVVGRTSIRHRLNDFLLHEGGHIGYGVLPPHRRRGYASEILRQSLERIHALGVDRVLVTCDDDNLGSATVIERAGGVLEDVVVNESGTETRRYWIG